MNQKTVELERLEKATILAGLTGLFAVIAFVSAGLGFYLAFTKHQNHVSAFIVVALISWLLSEICKRVSKHYDPSIWKKK